MISGDYINVRLNVSAWHGCKLFESHLEHFSPHSYIFVHHVMCTALPNLKVDLAQDFQIFFFTVGGLPKIE